MNPDLLLFLLLPVAAASGWWLARREEVSTEPGRADFSTEYFAGLNYLLNEQPDKAVDVFIKMLEVDSNTVETHLALGNLFRRRGEADRAIRIHQNLIARPTLTREQRAQALEELAKDYMRAGFLDRAESLFLELVENKDHRGTALDHLLDIYQQEKDWEKAISVSRNIEGMGRKHTSNISAQYCCELAERSYHQGEFKFAQKTAKRALEYDKHCVRATLLMGKMEFEGGNYRQAIKYYLQIEKQNPTYLSETIEPLLSCYHALGQDDEAEAYLSGISGLYGSVVVILALAELTRLKHGEQAAAETVFQAMKKQPSIKGLARLLSLLVASREGETRETLIQINQVVERLIEKQVPYRCENCGFQGKTLHWQCPTCRTWGSVKPIQAEQYQN